MTERLTGGLPPEALRALSQLALDEAIEAPAAKERRVSLKDAPYVDILRERPELAVDIVATMSKLVLAGRDVPVFHITSRGVRYADGNEESTGYLENIQEHGFRARDTNVAALMERGASVHIGDPEYFAEHPHKFLRAMGESMRHYAHHGVRTNKQTLGGQRDSGLGVPTMLVIDATDVPLVPGTDYDDHFMLGKEVAADRIMGTIELEGRKPGNPADVAAVSEDFLAAASAYADAQMPAGR